MAFTGLITRGKKKGNESKNGNPSNMPDQDPGRQQTGIVKSN